MGGSLKGMTTGLLVAAFMLYFPHAWCSWRKESEEEYGLKWFMGRGAWRDTIWAILLTLVPLTFASMNWPREWGGPGPFHPDLWKAVNMLGGGLAAAFIEETFYRGWLQTLAARRWGPRVAVFLAALLFALSHFFVASGWLRFATFFPGLVMGLLRWRNGSVLPSIIYHAVCNVWAVWWSPM
jgi:membrane protease YdiL (CAAX protease family)